MLTGMADHHEVVVTRWPFRTPSADDGLAGLLAAYHLQTEKEKGEPVAEVAGLPERYLAEVADPRSAFASDVVLVASIGDDAVGCVVLAPAEGWAEIKRLWVSPEMRSRGIASSLLEAALKHAGGTGARTVRLSVWEWRTNAIALYERAGFTVVDSWDPRPQLVCMEHRG
ncbi:hypothetical protein Pta02_52100 [Planobispora takensis]|uniref:N-acetyltransferase domain-containing protein n=2 Tax=Planobispora takensis TaxID=1367882 RepID=A0A8J3WXU4_9ACTN|nr:hypothetical protein Pta02_52100 [Planobispora takensis]